MYPSYDSRLENVPEVCSSLTFLVLALTWAAETKADLLVARDDRVWFEPGEPFVDVSHQFLLANDSGQGAQVELVVDAGAPLHGTVTVAGTGFRYTPKATAGLASLRTDNFAYCLDDGAAVSCATVHVILRTDDWILEQIGFEAGEPQGYDVYSPEGTAVEVLPGAAAAGVRGLSVALAAAAGEAFIQIDHGGQGTPPESGRVAEVGCGFEGVQDPVAILTVGPSRLAGGEENLRVVLRPDGAGGVEIRVETRDGDVFRASPGLPVDAGHHHVDLDWWPGVDGPGGAEPGGAILRFDGQAIEMLEVLQAGLDLSTVQVGVMPLEGPLTGPIDIDFDQVTIYEQGRTVGEPLIFFDDFEAGALDAGWDDAFGGGASVAAGGAISGGFGLLADPAFSTSYHVANDPLAEPQVNARFRLDVSGLTMAPNEFLRLFDLGSDASPLFGFPDVNIRLTSLHGVLNVAAIGAESEGLAFTPWQPVSGSHIVELQWQVSAGESPSGYFRLWLDGVPVGTKRHLDSVSEAVEWFHFGILGVDPGTRGRVLFDDLFVWR